MLNLGDASNLACTGEGPKYKEILDLISHFFVLAISASGVNAYTGQQKSENDATLLALLLRKNIQYKNNHLLHLVDGEQCAQPF